MKWMKNKGTAIFLGTLLSAFAAVNVCAGEENIQINEAETDVSQDELQDELSDDVLLFDDQESDEASGQIFESETDSADSLILDDENDVSTDTELSDDVISYDIHETETETQYAVKDAAADTEEFLKSVTQVGRDFVLIEWNKIDTADGYTIYRSRNNESFTAVKTVTACSAYNYNLENATSYTYKIRPYSLNAGGQKQYGSYSNEISIYIGVGTPSDVKIKLISKNSAVLEWTGDPYADGYILYRSTDENKWTLVKRVSEMKTATYGLTENSTYYFRLKAYRNVNGVERCSDYSESVNCPALISNPTNLSVTQTGKTTVALKWDPAEGASGYRVYRAENGGQYQIVKTVSEPSTFNYHLSDDVNYSYRVAALQSVGNDVRKTGYSNEVSICLGLNTPASVSVEYHTKSSTAISWAEVENATAYRLYRKDESGNSTLIKTVTGTSTINYGLTEGQCYSYAVKAVREGDAYTAVSEISSWAGHFHAKISYVSYAQPAVNQVLLSWPEVTGAKEYRVYFQDNTTLLSTVQTNEAFLSMSEADQNFIIVAVRNDIESEAATVAVQGIVLESALKLSVARAVDSSQVTLAWDTVEKAQGYELARCTGTDGEYSVIISTDKTNYLDTSVTAGTTYSYKFRAKYNTKNSSFNGSWSEAVSVEVPAAAAYRALLIGEEAYTETLKGPANDVEAVSNTLSGLTPMNWTINSQVNATKHEVVSFVNLAFKDATENDVSLFFYSGHGVTDSGTQYSGALMTVDYDYILLSDLAEMLSAVPGKVIVILDSCGSGAAVYSSQSINSIGIGDESSSFDPQKFNEEAISAFSNLASVQNKSGEFRNSKYYVLTASAYGEDSKSVMTNNIWGGALTRGFVASAGYDFNTKTWLSSMNGDANHDNIVTLNECYIYCADYASGYQNVQVYPENSDFKLFIR